MADNNVHYNYKFIFSDGCCKEFDVILDPETLNSLKKPIENAPDWAILEYKQCPCCKLNKKSHKYCPAALSLIEIINAFKDFASYEKINLTIKDETRTYSAQQTSLQKGVGALIGLCMASSGCPILGKLKPMVRYHLPLATGDETTYRAVSMYLLSQYFVYRKGGKPDWDMKKLVKIYNDIKLVNENFIKRLHSACSKDASLNAMIILDVLAEHVLFLTGKNSLKTIEKLFSSKKN
jgi:hypothetical protein